MSVWEDLTVWDFLDIIDSWKLVGWGKMGFKAQTCWTNLLAFRSVWNWSRILNFGPDRLFFRFSRALGIHYNPAGTWRKYNVASTSMQRRCIDLEATLYLHHVPAGKHLIKYPWRMFSWRYMKIILILRVSRGVLYEFMEYTGEWIYLKYSTLVAKLDDNPTGDQEVAGSIPDGSAIFFCGDWPWNSCYGHFLPSTDSRRAVVSFWRKNMHNTG